MPERTPDFRIAPEVYREWEDRAIPHRFEDVVDAIVALRDGEFREIHAPAEDDPYGILVVNAHAFGASLPWV